MLINSFQKLVLIPVLTLGAGLFISMGESSGKQGRVLYPEHLTGTFTGGFGEETCHSCHFDYDVNWKEGKLTVTGVPVKVQPGMMYELEIEVRREDLSKAGFQLSSRFGNGTQAGSFQVKENERLMLTKQAPDSLQFLQHSNIGTEPVEETLNCWTVQWKAPDIIADSIYFHISANAANGDQSEFGDWIYVQEFITK